jgi:carboxypeptidase Taq
MIGGSLRVSDLRDAWDEAMMSSVGVRPEGYADGCLQDIHWMDGAFGYFPSYTIGAMLAAQIRSAMDHEGLCVEDYVTRGEFGPIRAWLTERIHSKGCLLSTEELVVHATGKPLDASAFLAHIDRRYLDA